MLSPREAISRGQVFLRPFGHFAPGKMGYMGFAREKYRNGVLDRMEDGALVLIWTRSHHNESGNWKGSFRGILQLVKQIGPASAFSATSGIPRSSGDRSDYSLAIRATRSWEADPASKRPMKEVIPFHWDNNWLETLGRESGLMHPDDLKNVEDLKVREVSVFGCAPVGVAPNYEKVSALFR